MHYHVPIELNSRTKTYILNPTILEYKKKNTENIDPKIIIINIENKCCLCAIVHNSKSF